MLGMSRPSLYFRESGKVDWTLPELVKITEIMKENGLGEQLTVSCDGKPYTIAIEKVA